tara:strand:- start:192 stop:581 length:390 start_codon:yes stop_codon:yes gene_type:complete
MLDEDKEMLAEDNPEALVADGMEEAYIGFGHQYGNPPVAIYDSEKCVEALVKEGLTYEEAQEWFDFNTACAWVGEGTPIFMTRCLTKQTESVVVDKISPGHALLVWTLVSLFLWAALIGLSYIIANTWL